MSELTRRRVPQTTAVYLVVAFGVLEAADLAFPRLGLPDWAVTLVLALLLLGLPVVIFLSWSFDLTWGGVERTPGRSPSDPAAAGRPGPDAAGTAAADPGRSGPPGRLAVAVAVLVLAAVGLAGWALIGGVGSGEPLQADLVVVPPFRVSGDAEYLEEGMVDLLAAKLTGEGGLRAVEPRAVLAAWNADASPEEAAADVARDLGAGKILLGSVVATGGRLVVAGRIHRTDDFSELARHEVEGPADSLPVVVDRFLAGLLAQVAGVDASRVRILQETPLPALRAYLEGHAELRASRFSQARDAFERAITIDTAFAQAGVFYTIAAGFTDEGTNAGMRLAWRHRDRLAPRDRAMVEGYLGPEYPDWSSRQQMIEARRRATRAAPDRAEAWYVYGDYIYHSDLARPLGARLDDAERAFQQAVDLDPDFAPAAIHLITLGMYRGDTTTVRRRAEAFLDGTAQGDIAVVARTLLDILDGRGFVTPPDSVEYDFFRMAAPVMVAKMAGIGAEAADAAAAWVSRVASDAETAAHIQIAFHHLDRGRPARALELLEDRAVATPIARSLVRVYSALYWETGEPIEVLEPAVRGLERYAEDRTEYEGINWSEAACVVGQFRAAVGDWTAAREWSGVLEERGSREGTPGRYARSCNALIDALIAIEVGTEGAVEEAITRLDRAHADGTASETWLRDAATLVLARGYERLGDLDRALAATRRRVIEDPDVPLLSTQLREEGRLAAALGRTDEAVGAYRHYLALRSDPEPSAEPFAAQVRDELVRLTGESGR